MTASQRTVGARDTWVGRILAPTDFSQGATKALQWAVAVKTAFHAELVVLHVVDLDALAYLDLGGDPALGGASRPVSLELLERISADADKALSRITGSFPEIQPLLREGSPRAVILEVAKELGTDLIVLGTHGRSGMAGEVFGGVAEHVIRHSKVPVLAVRALETA